MSPRRRSAQGGLVTIRWRDIPAQVTASRDGKSAKALLDARFQDAIDRAAVVAGLTDTQRYVAEWRRDEAPLPGDDLEVAAAAEAARTEAAFPATRLEALVAGGGTEAPDATGAP